MTDPHTSRNSASATTLLANLQQVIETLTATSSEADVFQVIVPLALIALGAEAGTVLLLAGDELHAAALYGQNDLVVPWQRGPLRMNSPTADAFNRRLPLFFDHLDALLAAYPSLKGPMDGWKTVASAVLPILVDDQPQGVIVLDFRQAHAFTELERRFLQVVSTQCGSALKHLRQLRQQEQQILERTAVLNAYAALTEAAGTEMDVRILAQEAINVLQRFLPELSVGYHQLDNGWWNASVLSDDLPPDAVTAGRVGHAFSTPILLQAVKTRTCTFVDDFDALQAQVPHAAAYGALAFYPYFRDGQPHSMLIIGTQQTRHWTDAAQAMVSAVGRSLGLAIERAEVSQRLHERSTELAAQTRALEGFSSITRTLTPGSDPYLLIRQAEELVLSMLPQGYAHYYELIGGRWNDRVQIGDMRNPALQARVNQGFEYEDTPSLFIPWTTRQPLYQDEYLRGRDTDPDLVAHLHTVASLPVLVDTQPVGVLVFVLLTPRRWSRTDKAVMETTARSLGLTLERSQQARQQQEERDALEAFALLTEAVGSEHDILVLARQACAVLRALFRDGSAVYCELDPGDGLWKARVWTDDLSVQVQAQLTAGLSAETPLIARVLSSLETSFSEHWGMEDAAHSGVQAYTSAGTCPLIVSGRVQGLISVGLTRASTWGTREKGLLRAVGRSLTLALERAELTRQVDEDRAALAAFAALTEAVGTQIDVLDLARQAAQVIQASLSNISFAYYEPEGDRWIGRVWSDDLTPEIISQLQAGVPMSAPNYFRATRSAEPLFVEHWDAAGESLSSATSYAAAAFLPIMLGGQARGFVTAGIQGAKTWTVREQRIIRSVVRGLALALERADAARHKEVQQLALIEARSRAEWAVREADRQRSHAETMTHLAHHDALTGLLNRAGLSAKLTDTISAGTPFALFYLDLDGFKAVNDTLGHDAGDALLIQITAVLSREVLGTAEDREQVLARIGGDEFTIMVSGVLDRGEAAAIALKIRSALDQPFRLADRDVLVTASTGMTLFPSDGQTSDELLKNADLAMYQVKRNTKNGWQHYLPGMNEEARARLLLTSGLRGALARDEFQLHYQPQIDLESGEVRCLEALLRWFPTDGAPISPDRFIPAAEASGLIVPIGQWVLETACAQLAVWRDSGFPDLRVAVNVSPVQFARADFMDGVQRALDLAGLEGSVLELELTERGVLADLPTVLEQFRALRSLGVQIALDDFGAGESNLGRLLHLPFDVLKLDRYLSSTLGNDPDSYRFMRALQTFASGLNLELVAEGIETPAQLEAVRALGCQRAQGYLLGRPAAAWPPPSPYPAHRLDIKQ
ncbi:EAL domain-containing protein [Deinococcus ruber]|uniref:Diguanylate cyclase n=1 Tax=Deinococcus ruber TaxID=1848197 RepID=A0A918FFE6_9DEIO|nr:EAL domain-containing protein [Deinococcus ruber]GGR34702.1 hypothetical protein GCM10008957_50970 [Deinococcus ruber]